MPKEIISKRIKNKLAIFLLHHHDYWVVNQGIVSWKGMGFLFWQIIVRGIPSIPTLGPFLLWHDEISKRPHYVKCIKDIQGYYSEIHERDVITELLYTRVTWSFICWEYIRYVLPKVTQLFQLYSFVDFTVSMSNIIRAAQYKTRNRIHLGNSQSR